MFAIVEAGGKQYRVEVGDVLEVELISPESIKKNLVTMNTVLLVNTGDETLIGTPYVTQATVKAKVLGQVKSDKVLVFKKKPKKQFRRTRGHRQNLHQIQIEKIDLKPLGEKETE